MLEDREYGKWEKGVLGRIRKSEKMIWKYFLVDPGCGGFLLLCDGCSNPSSNSNFVLFPLN